MPVRLLSSSVFKWPDFKKVDRAIRCWSEETVQNRKDILRIGYIGSYARGDWSVGSDLDIIILVAHCTQPFWRRSTEFDLTSLPVPVDVLVYTKEEWESMMAHESRFSHTIHQEAIWTYEKNE